jgi:hypothetical protein
VNGYAKPNEDRPTPDTAEEICAAVEQRFAPVARHPDAEKKFPVGPASALGYDGHEIDALPPSATDQLSNDLLSDWLEGVGRQAAPQDQRTAPAVAGDVLQGQIRVAPQAALGPSSFRSDHHISTPTCESPGNASTAQPPPPTTSAILW